MLLAEPYMRSMVVEPQLIIQDGEGRMIQLQKVLQPPASLVRYSFDIIYLDRRNINGSTWGSHPAKAESRNPARNK